MQRLETERLILRNWDLNDIDDAFAFYSNPNCMIPQGDYPFVSKEECARAIEYLISAQNNYAIVLKSNNTVIGSIGLNEDARGNSNIRNLGFILNEDYWNQGIMKEALQAVIAIAPSITSALSAGSYNNPVSKHLLEKFDFKIVDTLVGIQRSVDDHPHDESYYILNL